MKLKIPPPVVFLLTVGLMKITPVFILLTVPVVGVVVSFILLIGLVFSLCSLIALIQRGTTISPYHLERTRLLVTTGVYSISRNPMYFSLVLYLLAYGIWLENLLALIWIVIFMFYLTYWQIKPEEKQLAKIFGEQFFQYKQKVRRWI